MLSSEKIAAISALADMIHASLAKGRQIRIKRCPDGTYLYDDGTVIGTSDSSIEEAAEDAYHQHIEDETTV